MKLPGSRPDILRTKSLSGPSPVGGSFGGTDSQSVMTLDDFELQAAHYNMACANARLGQLDDVRSKNENQMEVYRFANAHCVSTIVCWNGIGLTFLSFCFILFLLSLDGAGHCESGQGFRKWFR